MFDVPGILDTPLRRRHALHVGGYGALAALLNQSSAAFAANALPNQIESCILLMHYGGPSHLDTWDMKPQASAEIRGEYQPIATSVPGRVVCEHLSHCAKIVDKLTVIRSMHHPLSNHNAAMYEALIGRLPVGGDNEILGAHRTTDFPSMGSVVTYATAERQLAQPKIPLTNVALPHVMKNVVDLPGQNAGFLTGKYDPLQIQGDPNHPQFRVENLALPGVIDRNRMLDRRRLLDSVSNDAGIDSSLETYQQRAFELLNSPQVQKAFAIEQESDATRDRYGRNRLGQSLLLARRLVESGVRFINVNDGIYNGQTANWDSHENLFPRHKELLAPADLGFSALIEDLATRGLLDTTLVIAMGEFGRTPRINANAGRDHWPECYSVVMAGGGLKPGTTYGASDRSGAKPEENPVTPGDLAATIFWRFGIDPQTQIIDPLDRPFPLAEGEPITAMFS